MRRRKAIHEVAARIRHARRNTAHIHCIGDTISHGDSVGSNGRTHALTSEWRGHGGVVIMGFAHDAREGMDRWVEALGLNEADDYWIELPVIGDVNSMVRPMIRSGMRARYASTARRSHVAPVFDNAAILRGPSTAEIEVLVISSNGEVVARVEGEATTANVAAIVAAR